MDFSTLKELVQIISKNRVKNLAVLGNPGQEEKRTSRLYDLVSKGKINSDIEAAKAILGPDYTKKHTFRRVKQRLAKQLINTVFFMDFDKPRYHEREKAFYHCNRDLAAANLLLVNNAYKSAYAILMQVLENASNYEFFDIKADATRLLIDVQSKYQYDTSQYKFYRNLNRKYEYERYWTRRAINYYEELVQLYIVDQAPIKLIQKKSRKFYNTLFPRIGKISNQTYTVSSYLIAVVSFSLANDYRQALDVAQKALAEIETNTNVNMGLISMITAYILQSLIQLQIHDYNYGTLIFHKGTLRGAGKGSWLIMISEYIIFLLHQKKYDEALEYVRKKTETPNTLADNEVYSEYWTLLSGYLFLLAAFGKLPREELTAAFGPFRVGKFMNSFAVFSKEKTARNIPIILLPLLFALAEGKTKYHGPSPEALEKYRMRRLETENNRRSAIFIRLLLAGLEKLEHPENTSAAEKKIEKELAALYALPMKDVAQPHMVEIIPYEHLWEMIIENETRRQQNIT